MVCPLLEILPRHVDGVNDVVYGLVVVFSVRRMLCHERVGGVRQRDDRHGASAFQPGEFQAGGIGEAARGTLASRVVLQEPPFRDFHHQFLQSGEVAEEL